MTGEGGAVLPALPESAATRYWLKAAQVAELAGCSVQAIQKALLGATEGHSWNGAELEVRKQGRAYLVYAPSLPPHLYRKFYDANREALAPAPGAASATELPHKKTATDPQWAAKQYRIAEWLAGIIAPALDFPRNSHGRGEVLRSLAEQTFIRPTDGKPLRIKEGTLRAYCRRFEEGGMHALMRKERKAEEKPRVLITRKWQKACPLPPTIREKLAQEIELHIRGLWAAGAPSRDKVREIASAELARRCREAGWDEATLKNCDVGQYLVESTQEMRRVAVYERDAKRFSDKLKPRIRRDRADLKPGQCIVGDVHPVDILLCRADGSTYTPRMIAWYDMATNRCFYTLLHPAPGQSVTQADVTRSFVNMCMAWDIPRILYLDNGPEYSWNAMVEGFKALAGMGAELDLRLNQIEALEAQWLAEDGAGNGDSVKPAQPGPSMAAAVVRAKPYNAAAKPIEGAFSAKEKVLSMLPGYIGGDRMNKRVSKVGRAPDTYPGTPEAFDQEFAEAMAFFHAMPQRGHLKGNSPNGAYARARHLATSTKAELAVLFVAFSEEKTLKVRTQGVQLGSKEGGRWYYDDALIPLIGKTCRFRVAKWKAEYIALVEGSGANTRYNLIHESRAYAAFDLEGARESSRREGRSRHYVRGLKASAPPADLRASMKTYVEEQGRCMPDVSSTLEPQERRIGLSDGLKALSDQLQRGNPNPVEILAPGEFRDVDGVIQRHPTREQALKDGPPLNRSPLLPEPKVERPKERPKDPFDFLMEERREAS